MAKANADLVSGPSHIETDGLRITFNRAGDRFGHIISVLNQGSWQEVLRSVEGSPDDDWPPSPALQQLHEQKNSAGQPLLLLVGMAGTSHWSLSIEPHAVAAGIQFDAACRVKQQPQQKLQSCYEVVAETYRIEGDSSDDLIIEFPTAAIRIDLAGEAVGRVVTGSELPQVILRPLDLAMTVPATRRWRYTISRE